MDWIHFSCLLKHCPLASPYFSIWRTHPLSLRGLFCFISWITGRCYIIEPFPSPHLRITVLKFYCRYFGSWKILNCDEIPSCQNDLACFQCRGKIIKWLFLTCDKQCRCPARKNTKTLWHENRCWHLCEPQQFSKNLLMTQGWMCCTCVALIIADGCWLLIIKIRAPGRVIISSQFHKKMKAAFWEKKQHNVHYNYMKYCYAKYSPRCVSVWYSLFAHRTLPENREEEKEKFYIKLALLVYSQAHEWWLKEHEAYHGQIKFLTLEP